MTQTTSVCYINCLWTLFSLTGWNAWEETDRSVTNRCSEEGITGPPTLTVRCNTEIRQQSPLCTITVCSINVWLSEGFFSPTCNRSVSAVMWASCLTCFIVYGLRGVCVCVCRVNLLLTGTFSWDLCITMATTGDKEQSQRREGEISRVGAVWFPFFVVKQSRRWNPLAGIC